MGRLIRNALSIWWLLADVEVRHPPTRACVRIADRDGEVSNGTQFDKCLHVVNSAVAGAPNAANSC
jgi:hypothetical protein